MCIRDSFAIALPDMLISKEDGKNGDSLKQMKINFDKYKKSSILLGKARKEDIPKYGIAKIIKTNKFPCLGLIKKIIEKPSIKKAPSNLYATGRYIFNNDLFKYLNKVEPDKSGEIQLTDAIDQYISDDNQVMAFALDGEVYDCGDKTEYVLANIDFASRDPLMKIKIKNFLKKKLF